MKKIVVIVLAVIAIASLMITGSAIEPAAAADGGDEVTRWIGQVDVGAEDPLFASVQRACQRITRASSGRLELTVEPAGAIVPERTEFDGVHEGVIDFAVTLPGWWTDKFAAAGLFGSRHGGMSPKAKYLWFISGGGAELAQQMIDAYDVRLVPGGVWLVPPALFLHSRYPINTLDDFQHPNFKMRSARGDMLEILLSMEVNAVPMPGGEIYEALQEEVIYAAEYSSAIINWNLGLNEVATYVYLSECRAPHQFFAFLVNKTSWEELPDDLKVLVEKISREAAIAVYAETCQADIEAIEWFEADERCTVEKLPKNVRLAFLEKADEYYEAKALENEFYAEVLQSLRDFEEVFREYWERP